MAECYRCPYMYNVLREYGITNYCGLACDHFDVTYYCEEPNRSKENIFCPFVFVSTRIPNVNYHFKLLKTVLDKYETNIFNDKGKKE